jgi:ABC-type multidrug transport system ATPase subunit
MLHITRTSKLAVIITTHYIDEAKQADRCGLMRNGILLAEDTPLNIISRHEVDNLEEAFLKLCTKRGMSEDDVDTEIERQHHCNEMQMDNLEMQDRTENHMNGNDKKIVPISNNNNNIQNHNHNSATSQEQEQPSPTQQSSAHVFKRKKYTWSTLQALFTKNYLQMKRQPA